MPPKAFGVAGERTTCPVCQGRFLRPKPRYRQAFLATCLDCDHVTATAIPSEVELEAHYTEYDRYQALSRVTLARYSEILNSLERFRRVNRLVDFGCGAGHFLLAARERGWKVWGVESDERARRVCAERGLDVKPSLGTCDSAENDVATAFEVLEHLIDPAEVCQQIRQVLRPGGCLYLTTPNFGALSRRLLGPKWRVVQFPGHLQYFNRASLVRLADRTGFAVARIWSSGMSPGDILNAVAGSTPLRQRGQDLNEVIREAGERRGLDVAKRMVNWGLRATDLGDTLKVCLIAI
jgi:SAM-dependent methyltransferase